MTGWDEINKGEGVRDEIVEMKENLPGHTKGLDFIEWKVKPLDVAEHRMPGSDRIRGQEKEKLTLPRDWWLMEHSLRGNWRDRDPYA